MFTLNNIMRMNGFSCLLFGLYFFISSDQISIFLSEKSPIPANILVALGMLLLLNSAHIFWVAKEKNPSQFWVIYFSIGDFIWVAASIILIAIQVWVTTYYGIVVTSLIALMVGSFGILQLLKARQAK